MANKNELPRFLLEDYFQVLRGLVILAWVGFAAAASMELFIRLRTAGMWPEFGGFSLIFHFVIVQYGLCSLLLTALIIQRDWYERVPRASVGRLKILMVAAFIWQVVHFLSAFHITGSFNGTLSFYVPLLLVATLIFIPGLIGWVLSGCLVLGVFLVYTLEESALIGNPGPLAGIFSYERELTTVGSASVVLLVLLALGMAVLVRMDRFPALNRLHRVQRHDSETGLFDKQFLYHRVELEINRIRHQGGSAVLLAVEFSDQVTADSLNTELVSAAGKLLGAVRLQSDTPARYSQNGLAVLLPTAQQKDVVKLGQRILDSLFHPDTRSQVKVAMVVFNDISGGADAVWSSLRTALKNAKPGQAPEVVGLEQQSS